MLKLYPILRLYYPIPSIYTMYLFNFRHSNELFKTLPQSFHKAQSQKKIYGVRHSVRAGSSPRRRPRLPPPNYAHTILLGGKTIPRRKNYSAAE